MAPWSNLVPWTRDPSPGRLVQECEWLLAGRYVELREREGAPVPRWAWANLLAHGAVRDLSAARHPSAVAALGETTGRWRQARAFLCGEVLDRSGPDGDRLAALQAQVLVPLELQLMTLDGGLGAETPARFVDAVLRALRRHDAAHPAP